MHAGADPRTVTLKIAGADSVRIDDGGNVLIDAGFHVVRHAAPFAYQSVAGRQVAVATRYVLVDDGSIRFDVGAYDRSRTLVIDPFIAASRLVGGVGTDGVVGYDRIENLSLGADGRLYAYGTINSANFPGIDTTKIANGGQGQVFVARLRPDTLAIEYVAVVGRRSAERLSNVLYRSVDPDRVEGFAVGADGTVFVAAYSSSTQVPAAGDTFTSGAGAKYIFRIDGQGNVTPHAGPLDSAIQTIRAIAVDAKGSVYFTGRATSSLATTPGAMVAGAAVYASSHDSVRAAPYVIKLDATSRTTVVSTFLTVPYSRPANPNSEDCRDPDDDESTADAIVVGSDGSMYVAGQARPEDFPPTAGALDTGDTAFRDAFVAKLDPIGTALRFVTRIGGHDNDRATGIALTAGGAIAVVGKSLRSGWRTSAPGFQFSVAYQHLWGSGCESIIPPEEGFLVTLSEDGTRALSLSILGATGGNLDSGSPTGEQPMPLRIAVDAVGGIYVAGTTESGRSLPTLNPVVPDSALDAGSSPSTRPFIIRTLPDVSLVYGSRFGGKLGGGLATGVAADAIGNAFVAGYGNGPGFPIVHASGISRQEQYGYSFVTRINEAPAPLTLVASPSPGRVGDQVMLTARFFDPLLGGSVEFRDNGAVLATVPIVGGAAAKSIVLPVGVHRLRAVVRGAAPWDGHSTSDVDLVVEQTSATQ
ncbi:MAG: hypothetical protein ABI886_12535 [Betaproteobacteria bacterium]